MEIKINVAPGIANPIAQMVFIVTWVTGIVLANGFWSTLFAVFIPFWGWYLVIEKGLTMIGWI